MTFRASLFASLALFVAVTASTACLLCLPTPRSNEGSTTVLGSSGVPHNKVEPQSAGTYADATAIPQTDISPSNAHAIPPSAAIGVQASKGTTVENTFGHLSIRVPNDWTVSEGRAAGSTRFWQADMPDGSAYARVEYGSGPVTDLGSYARKADEDFKRRAVSLSYKSFGMSPRTLDGLGALTWEYERTFGKRGFRHRRIVYFGNETIHGALVLDAQPQWLAEHRDEFDRVESGLRFVP